MGVGFGLSKIRMVDRFSNVTVISCHIWQVKMFEAKTIVNDLKELDFI